MRKFIYTTLVLGLALYLIPSTEAAGPARFGVGAGVGLQRARVINPGLRNVAAFGAARAVGLGLGGLGYGGYNRSLGLGLGYNRGLSLGLGGYGHSAAFVQPYAQAICAQPFVQQYAQPFVQQSYGLVQPVQAFTQAYAQPVVQQVVAQPFLQQQVYSQAVTGCATQALGVQALGVGHGCGAQAIIGAGAGYGLGFRQPLLRQRFVNPRIQGFRY